jgi:hypothetical protein
MKQRKNNILKCLGGFFYPFKFFFIFILGLFVKIKFWMFVQKEILKGCF